MIIQNTTGNTIGAQMTSATDGSEFTSTVTVYLTLDGGTQTIGSVGAGICTHEGHGYHTYAIAQAETNAKLIGATFVGSGAITVTKEYETVTAATSLALVDDSTGLRTGQDLLNLMEVLNQELQLQTGEADVTRGVIALNVAQDYFESLAAQKGKIFGSRTGTVTTTANTESTVMPTGVLRIDRLQRLNSTTLLPEVELVPAKRTGGHVMTGTWPSTLFLSTTPGKPIGYWTNGTNIYWDPLPDATYSVRYYGFRVAADITANGTFAYPDVCQLPFASFAVKLLQAGVGDSMADLSGLATEAFTQVLNTLAAGDRDGASGFEYSMVHTT